MDLVSAEIMVSTKLGGNLLAKSISFNKTALMETQLQEVQMEIVSSRPGVITLIT